MFSKITATVAVAALTTTAVIGVATPAEAGPPTRQAAECSNPRDLGIYSVPNCICVIPKVCKSHWLPLSPFLEPVFEPFGEYDFPLSADLSDGDEGW